MVLMADGMLKSFGVGCLCWLISVLGGRVLLWARVEFNLFIGLPFIDDEFVI
jgi:hypothetical protein